MSTPVKSQCHKDKKEVKNIQGVQDEEKTSCTFVIKRTVLNGRKDDKTGKSSQKCARLISRFKNLLGRIYKSRKLCYSVNEADFGFDTDFPRILTPLSNWHNILGNQCFNVRRGYIVTAAQEISANVYGYSKVDLIGVSCIRSGNDYVRGKVFMAGHPNAAFCSPRCKNQYNVYKSRGKK